MASARVSWLSGVVLVSLAVQAGCSGAAQSVAPSAMLDMSQLPDEPDRRRERIESTEVRPGPEHRKPLPTKLQRVETAAATAAAVVGMFFSSTPSVLLGGGMTFDEGPVFQSREKGRKDAKDEEAGASDDEKIDAAQLVPWVRLPSGEPAP